MPCHKTELWDLVHRSAERQPCEELKKNDAERVNIECKKPFVARVSNFFFPGAVYHTGILVRELALARYWLLHVTKVLEVDEFDLMRIHVN